MQTGLSIILAIVLIPAGLVGISGGLSELLTHSHALEPVFRQILDASSSVLPWCRSLASIVVGTGLIGLAIMLVVRGLQSAQSPHKTID